MSAPRISVVMPSYNQGRFIRAAIDSVLGQGGAAVELLVMDGGSGDGTQEILASYGDRIRYVSQRDGGQSNAINQGFRRTTGEVVCWLNSDDMFTEGALLVVADTFARHPHTDFVYGRGWNTDEVARTRLDSGVLPFNRWRLIHHRNFVQQPSCFFRREVLERVGGIDEDLHYVMDWDLWIRLAAHRGVYVPEYLSLNREYGANKTQSGRLKRWQEIRRMVGRYTSARWPPVLSVYLLEAMIQGARANRLRAVERALLRPYVRGMQDEASGVYDDGGVRSRFHLTAGNPDGRDRVRLVMRPLSYYDRARRGQGTVRLSWQSSEGARGALALQESGTEQEFQLPLARAPRGGFEHFSLGTEASGAPLTPGAGLPARRIVGFVKQFESV